jgi:hypothetical protein
MEVFSKRRVIICKTLLSDFVCCLNYKITMFRDWILLPSSGGMGEEDRRLSCRAP